MGGLEKEGGKKRGGSDGHFSTLRALRFSESSPFKLVYLTFVWHFPSVPLLPQSGPLYASLPATKKQPRTSAPICTSLHGHSHSLPSKPRAQHSTWLAVSRHWYPTTEDDSNRKHPQTVVGNSIQQYPVGGQTRGVIAPRSGRTPRRVKLCARQTALPPSCSVIKEETGPYWLENHWMPLKEHLYWRKTRQLRGGVEGGERNLKQEGGR